MAIGIVVVGLRLGAVAQMIPSVGAGHAVSPRPGLYLATWLVAAAASVVVSVATVVRRRTVTPWWALADVLLAAMLLLVGVLTIPVSDRLGTWSGFVSGYAVAVLLSMCGVRSARVWRAGVVLTVLASLVYLWPLATGGELPAVASNAVTYVLLAVVGWIVARQLRRIAWQADEARALAASFARDEEFHRARSVFHNGVAVMTMLSEAGTRAVPRPDLQQQARAETNRMRAYLRGETEHEVGPSGDPRDRGVREVVASACGAFTELGVRQVTEPAGRAQLRGADVEAVRAALVSVLLNVARHAQARTVVVHAEADECRWTITVNDDGTGFCLTTAAFGVGLRDVVVGALARRGIEVELDSAPGLGTLVSMTGLLAPAGGAEP